MHGFERSKDGVPVIVAIILVLLVSAIPASRASGSGIPVGFVLESVGSPTVYFYGPECTQGGCSSTLNANVSVTVGEEVWLEISATYTITCEKSICANGEFSGWVTTSGTINCYACLSTGLNVGTQAAGYLEVAYKPTSAGANWAGYAYTGADNGGNDYSSVYATIDLPSSLTIPSADDGWTYPVAFWVGLGGDISNMYPFMQAGVTLYTDGPGTDGTWGNFWQEGWSSATNTYLYNYNWAVNPGQQVGVQVLFDDGNAYACFWNQTSPTGAGAFCPANPTLWHSGDVGAYSAEFVVEDLGIESCPMPDFSLSYFTNLNIATYPFSPTELHSSYNGQTNWPSEPLGSTTGGFSDLYSGSVPASNGNCGI